MPPKLRTSRCVDLDTNLTMCGIAGFFSFDRHDRESALERVERMANTMIHRGPDEKGYYLDSYVALGHRRLSIIDLSSGQQPMGVLDGKVQIVFNGEIYNYLKLKSYLEGKGHKFQTKSDTEVILKGYVEWGVKCVERLNGMFAFVIWDARNNTMLAARDRVGKKPLYYYLDDRTFAFASELKALRAGDLCPTSIDPESLDCFFSFGYIPAPRTIYKSVKKLSAATYLVVSRSKVQEARYWHLSFAEQAERKLEEAAEELEELLDDAVKCRLMSEVPLGVFLSGGIDSPLVLSSMARTVDKPITTNSIGFEVKAFNELPMARVVADRFKTNHNEFVVKPNVSEILDQVAWHFDEPFADSSAIPTWFVCKMARQNVTVALSGDGGDESFGGYTFRYIPHMPRVKDKGCFPPRISPIDLWCARIILAKFRSITKTYATKEHI